MSTTTTTDDTNTTRPVEVETSPIGVRRARRLRDALSAAESMLQDGETALADDSLRFAEEQILTADGIVDPSYIERAMKIAIKVGRASRVAPTVKTIAAIEVAPVVGPITTSNIIVGARVAGSGTVTSCRGSGELNRGRMVDILASANLPTDWAPRSHTAHAQLGRIVLGLRGGDRKTGAVRKSSTDTWAARWWVDAGQSTDVAVGKSASRRVLVVTLTETGSVEIEGDADLAQSVRAEFDRRTAGEVYSGNDVTRWFVSVLRDHFGAIALGLNWYVSAAHVESAQRFSTAVQDAGWGSEWMNAIPVSTTEQLRKGLASGLIAEARAVLDDLATKRAKARDEGRADVTSRVAVSLLADLRAVAERAIAVATVLGDDAIGNVRASVSSAIETIRELCDDTDARGALIWSEIAAEVA